MVVRTVARVDEPWDPVKARQNLGKHGVSFEEAQTVDEDEFRLTEPDVAHSLDEPRYRVIGASVKLRVLHVTCTYRAGRMRPISARRATKRECYEYLRGTRRPPR